MRGMTFLEILVLLLISICLSAAIVGAIIDANEGAISITPQLPYKVIEVDGHQYLQFGGLEVASVCHSASCRKCEERWRKLLNEQETKKQYKAEKE